MNTYRRRQRNFRVAVVTLVFVFAVAFILSGFFSNANAATLDTKTSYKYFTSISISKDMTLWSIAEEYISDEYASHETYIDEVKRINGLADDEIRYGEFLTIPYYSDELK